jgi:hypothetical protein
LHQNYLFDINDMRLSGYSAQVDPPIPRQSDPLKLSAKKKS